MYIYLYSILHSNVNENNLRYRKILLNRIPFRLHWNIKYYIKTIYIYIVLYSILHSNVNEMGSH